MTSPITTIRAALAADLPVMLWGPPGTGKTAAVQAMARDAGVPLVTIIAATMDPADVCGMPIPDHAAGTVRLAPPEWARQLAERPGWLFLDELSCAAGAVQAALLRVVHERTVGPLRLHPDCRVVAAGNRADTAATGGWLSPAAAGRWVHVEWTADAPAWCAGEIGGWGAPRSPRHAAAAAGICAFIRSHPAALLAAGPGDIDEPRRPSPRTWSMASRLLASAPAGADPLPLLTAAVGPAAASECAEYLGALDLPDPEALMAGRAQLPPRGDQQHASLLAVAAAAAADRPDRADRVRKAWGVLGAARPDVAIIAAQALLAAAPDIAPPSAVALGERIITARRRSRK